MIRVKIVDLKSISSIRSEYQALEMGWKLKQQAWELREQAWKTKVSLRNYQSALSVLANR